MNGTCTDLVKLIYYVCWNLFMLEYVHVKTSRKIFYVLVALELLKGKGSN